MPVAVHTILVFQFPVSAPSARVGTRHLKEPTLAVPGKRQRNSQQDSHRKP